MAIVSYPKKSEEFSSPPSMGWLPSVSKCAQVLTSPNIDSALTALAAGSFFLPFSWSGNFFIQGIRGFALANLADRALRRMLLKKIEIKEEPILKGAASALIEEGLYSGILLTPGRWGTIPRFAVSLVLGATAARAVIKISPAKITRDNQLGFLWAVFREIAFTCLPTRIAIPFLIAEDSAVYGLSAVCPTKSHSLIKHSPEWIYKSLSARMFRVVANSFALYAGFGSSAVQHLLFNFSRSFPE